MREGIESRGVPKPRRRSRRELDLEEYLGREDRVRPEPFGADPVVEVVGTVRLAARRVDVDAASRRKRGVPDVEAQRPGALRGERGGPRQPAVRGALEETPRSGERSSGGEVERKPGESDGRRQRSLEADLLGGSLAEHPAARVRRRELGPLGGRERRQVVPRRRGETRGRAREPLGLLCGGLRPARVKHGRLRFDHGRRGRQQHCEKGRDHVRHYCRRESQKPFRYSPSGQSSETGWSAPAP